MRASPTCVLLLAGETWEKGAQGNAESSAPSLSLEPDLCRRLAVGACRDHDWQSAGLRAFIAYWISLSRSHRAGRALDLFASVRNRNTG